MGVISAFLLERYNMGEVTAGEKAAVERALVWDEALAGRLAALRESDAAIWERYLPAGSGRAFPVRRRFARWRPRRVMAAAAVVCAVFSALWALRVSYSGTLPEGDRAKGGAALPATSLAVYLKTDTASPQTVSDGDRRVTLHEGDTIQLAYTAAVPGNAPVYGVIFSIDGRSTLTLHYPSAADGSTRLTAGKRTALNEAYTLDDAPRFEVFFMVVSAELPDMNVVLDKARLLAEDAARDRFPEDVEAVSARIFSEFEVKSLVIYKE